MNVSDGLVEVLILDDGQGFSKDALECFGKKRPTRYLSEKSNVRLSVGLGSVIMKAIVNAHGGTIVPENRVSEDGKTVGAQLRITLRSSYQLTLAQ